MFYVGIDKKQSVIQLRVKSLCLVGGTRGGKNALFSKHKDVMEFESVSADESPSTLTPFLSFFFLLFCWFF